MRKEVEREQQNASRGEMAQPMNTLVRVFGRREVIHCTGEGRQHPSPVIYPETIASSTTAKEGDGIMKVSPIPFLLIRDDEHYILNPFGSMLGSGPPAG